MLTLKDRYAEAYADLKKRGYKNITAMMEVMGKPSEIDKALGYNAAASHWMNRKNPPSWLSEKKAGDWVSKHLDSEPADDPHPTNNSPTLDEIYAHVFPEESDTFLAIIPADKRAKAMKLMTLIGIELVEV